MKAAFLSGPEHFERRELELAIPAPGQLLVDVVTCGVCGSNLHDWHRPGAGSLAIPGAVGHEVAAVVREAGPDTGDFAVGDPIAVQPSAIAGCLRRRPRPDGLRSVPVGAVVTHQFALQSSAY